MIGAGDRSLDSEAVERAAILLAEQKTDDEILDLIGNSIPVEGVRLLSDVREYSVQQIAPPDRLMLPSPQVATSPKSVGSAAFAVLRRVAWKTFCRPSSPIFKLWSERVPSVFNEGYFSAAAITALSDFKIGVPILASGLAALAMKYTAEEFCELSKPRGIMGSISDKSG